LNLRVLPEVQRPPTAIARMIEQRSPGFWVAFSNAIERGIGVADLVVTSWWRDAARNADVGGGNQSQHLIGTALDLYGPARDMELARGGLASQGLVAMVHAVAGGATHLHVQAWPAGVAARAGIFPPIRR
jgi:Peptidase M15